MGRFLVIVGAIVLLIGVGMSVIQLSDELQKNYHSDVPCIHCKINRIGDIDVGVDVGTEYPGLGVALIGAVILIIGHWGTRAKTKLPPP